ncbi:MAG: septum formation inhibitor Maf [Anaerolineae bacterium]|nr:septum formation inhibitor Maf [Anaerolineae bacterium]
MAELTSPLILASASPRRRDLLNTLGLPFEIVTSNVPEDLPPDISPEKAVRWLARLKAEIVAEPLQAGIVIGSDTEVVLEGQLLGKPTDPADACRMLRLLRGRSHRVISGIAVFDAAARRSGATSHVTTTVTMRNYTDAEIEAYVATGEPMDKAGAYAIQGRGGALVARIEGCYNNVVGFPLCEVVALLEGFGVRLDGVVPQPVCSLPDGTPCPRLRR